MLWICFGWTCMSEEHKIILHFLVTTDENLKSIFRFSIQTEIFQEIISQCFIGNEEV